MERSNIPAKRILVVDDEPYVCDALRMMLSIDGHEVTTASSARQGLDLLAQQPFDLVITDYSMPAMKGDEFASLVKARNPAQPVVMITAYAEMLSGSKTGGLPCIDVLISKPFRLEQLRQAVARVLGLEKTP
ncbi:MAG TPA: response regulator [Verrucomicrobiae bacterium]|nr:response regulator [Verrucomicrobiae bacterium]